MSCPVIQVSNLSYTIGGNIILRDVSFEVDAGDFLSIVGPNGAGKTTLLKCLNRILTGGQGSIQINGRPQTAYSQSELAVEIGYVPQGGTDDVAFSVYEFVMMGRYPHLSAFTSTSPEDEKVVLEALQVTGVNELRDRSCCTLSGGERQKVLIAAALAQEARILLLDEPTTFLDPHHQHEVTQLLVRLNRDEGVTVVAVTHDLNSAALNSKDFLALSDGRVVYHGPPGNFMNEATMAGIYGIGVQFARHPVTGDPMLVPEAIDI